MAIARRSAGGVDFELELERDHLLPGRLVGGVARLNFRKNMRIRGGYVTLIGREWWQYERSDTDSQGHSRTETVTRREDLPRVPVQLLGEAQFSAGETRELRFELPVPGLGPPTVDATVCGVSWEIEVKLDVPGFDPALMAPVTIAQPTALLRAGVVRVAQYALWNEADASASGISARIALDPVPLCIGSEFRGVMTIDTPQRMKLQEVRLELRVRAEATVNSGKSEERSLWVGRLAGAGEFGAGSQTIEFAGQLPWTWLPTARLPHGQTQATFRVVLARARARDPNLVRDVAVCSTTEL
jgi:hypothetical protein